MNITKKEIDALNAQITISVNQSDYQENVAKTLKDYRKKANIPGFRKGAVPMSYIKKQYEKPLIFDEVNKLLQQELNQYIQNEKLNILGNPMPKEQADIDWDAEELNFEFELGLAPEFDVDLSKTTVTQHKIVVGNEEVDKYINNFKKRFGSLKTLEKVEENANVNGLFVEVDADGNTIEGGLEKVNTLFAEQLKDWTILKDKKVDDQITINSQDLYNKTEDLAYSFGIEPEQAKEFNKIFLFTIKEISKIEDAQVNQELFDKVYGEGAVSTEEEFRNKVKEESEKMYAAETDRQLMNDTLQTLLNNTKFDLPSDFLSRWLLHSNDKIETLEQAKEEFSQSEKSIRYQLIQTKIAELFDIKVEHQDIITEAKTAVQQQLAMYGQTNVPDEQLEQFAQSAISNQEEYQRLADQTFGKKLLNVVKENVALKEKEVTFDDFLDYVKQQNKEPEKQEA